MRMLLAAALGAGLAGAAVANERSLSQADIDKIKAEMEGHLNQPEGLKIMQAIILDFGMRSQRPDYVCAEAISISVSAFAPTAAFYDVVCLDQDGREHRYVVAHDEDPNASTVLKP